MADGHDSERCAYATRFMVRAGHRVVIVPVREVETITANGNYLELHHGPRTHRLRATIQAVLPRLDPRYFARIHKSTIVNLAYVSELQAWYAGDYIALMHDGRKLRISRTFARALMKPMW